MTASVEANPIFGVGNETHPVDQIPPDATSWKTKYADGEYARIFITYEGRVECWHLGLDAKSGTVHPLCPISRTEWAREDMGADAEIATLKELLQSQQEATRAWREAAEGISDDCAVALRRAMGIAFALGFAFASALVWVC